MLTKRDVCLMAIGALCTLGLIAVAAASWSFLQIDRDTPVFIKNVRGCTDGVACWVAVNDEDVIVAGSDGARRIGTLQSSNLFFRVAYALGCANTTCTVTFHPHSPHGWEYLEIETNNGKSDFLFIEGDELFAHSSYSH